MQYMMMRVPRKKKTKKIENEKQKKATRNEMKKQFLVKSLRKNIWFITIVLLTGLHGRADGAFSAEIRANVMVSRQACNYNREFVTSKGNNYSVVEWQRWSN